jgi:quercetin dioxygenase-like cupin family protein
MTEASDAQMTGSGSRRLGWRHVRLDHDSPDLELADGVRGRLAMTNQVMVAKVVMTAGSGQDEHSNRGETVIVVVTGALSLSIAGESVTVTANELAIIPPDAPYSLGAGKNGCTRLDVFSPPDFNLAAEAFHQEHANHGFE